LIAHFLILTKELLYEEKANKTLILTLITHFSNKNIFLQLYNPGSNFVRYGQPMK